MASKFAVDAFTTATFSTTVTDDIKDIRDFNKAPLVEAVLNLLAPNWKSVVILLSLI